MKGKRMVNVLFVAHSGEISGGANRSLLSVMEELMRRGIVKASLLVPDKDSELQKRCGQLGIPVYIGHYHRCCTEYRGQWKDIVRFAKIHLAPLLDRWEARRLNRVLPGGFEMVYTNDRMIVVGGFFARCRGIPHIWHVRSFADENGVSYRSGYLSLMDQFSDRIVLISRALWASFAEKIPEGKLRLVHNGIDPEKYEVQLKEHEGIHLLLTGRIVPAKGHRDAIRATGRLLRSGQKYVQLFFAGQMPPYGENDYLESLRREIADAGAAGHVHFLGEREDICDVRSTTDIELVCSSCEAFGRVTVEAMAAGIPVIGTDAGGTRDIIIDGVTGFLYPPGNDQALYERILHCLQNPQEIQEITRMAKRYVQEHFSISETAKRIEDVILELTQEEAI